VAAENFTLQSMEQAEAERSQEDRPADLSTLARRSLLNFVGGAAFGLLSFAWVVLVTRGWGADRAGVLLEAVAFFTIATGLVVLGSEESVLRAISRARAFHLGSLTRRTLAVSLGPIFVFSVIVAAVTWVWAPRLAELFLLQNEAPDRLALEGYIRLFAPALPFTALYFAVLAATRGFGAMVPTVAIERVGRTGGQLVLAGAVIAAGLGTIAMGLSWVLPYVIGLAFGATALRRLIHRDEHVAGVAGDVQPIGRVAATYWRFSAFRGLASVLQVTSLWIDTLLVGTLVSASSTAVYTTCSRTVRLGSVVLLALVQALAPQISDLLARHQVRRAEHVYRTSTWWLMTLTWPLYLCLIVFAPVVLRLFGHGFTTGATVVATMSAAMLVSTACGPVDMILLMGGKSGWNLFNNVIALGVDVVLIFVLVPKIGIEGAAIAWAVSVVANNVLPWAEIRLSLKITPFSSPGLIPALASLAAYGIVGVALRTALGATFGALTATLLVGTVAYAAVLYRFRHRLEFASLFAAVRRRGRHEPAVVRTAASSS
jgi:O-antigen/teichoic acid export membrane protein